jgi:7-cyano-7-deazaguanine reductase
MNNPSSYQGLQQHIPDLLTPEIEIWDFQYPNSNSLIEIRIPEFTCICPKTGLPDFGEIIIRYKPANSCLELKSLKEYIVFYRDLGVFHEHLTNKILEDCVKACNPNQMDVIATINPRGGIHTTVTATYKKGN